MKYFFNKNCIFKNKVYKQNDEFITEPFTKDIAIDLRCLLANRLLIVLNDENKMPSQLEVGKDALRIKAKVQSVEVKSEVKEEPVKAKKHKIKIKN